MTGASYHLGRQRPCKQADLPLSEQGWFHCTTERRASRALSGSSARAVSMVAGEESSTSGRHSANEEPSSRLLSRPSAARPCICILGGGFGGLYTALRLSSLTWPSDKQPQVLLVDQCDRFVFKPLLYELLSREVDTWEIAPKFLDLLSGTGVNFIQDTVKSVTPSDHAPQSSGGLPHTGRAGTVRLGSGTEIIYDWLVLAMGAETRMSFVEGAKEHAVPFATLQDALRADEKLTELERLRDRGGIIGPQIRVAIVGAGYSGVELACTVAERLGDRGEVQIIDPAKDICANSTVYNREAAKKILHARGVKLMLKYKVSAMRIAQRAESASRSRVTPTVLVLEPVEGGTAGGKDTQQPPSLTVEADLVLWTVGTRAALPSSSREGQKDQSSFQPNGRGQADTDDTLRVRQHPRVFAIGDVAGTMDASGQVLPATAQVAFQQADYVAWNLWAAINDRPLLPFRYQNLGEMMTLGTNQAAVSVGLIEGLNFDGPFAHAARRIAYWYRLPTNDHKLKVGLSWLTKSAIDALAVVQRAAGFTSPTGR
eukprot:SM000069S20738  [mRNA]  locus=s69:614561:617671:- [translate_table: standard]